MIIVAGTLKTAPDKVREVHTALMGGAEASRAEDGCLYYTFGIVDEARGEILAYERWRDEPALRAHLDTPHIKAFVDRHGAAITEMDVSIYDAANERPVGV